MLATIREDTCNVLNKQHITPNSKRCDYSGITGCDHKKIKGPDHMFEGGNHFRTWVMMYYGIRDGGY